MDERDQRTADAASRDTPPGEAAGWKSGLAKSLIGLAASIVLTLASFWAAGTHLVWGPGVPVLLAALAIGQMGVHLVFFLHITSDPDNTNNALALAFGVLIVLLVIVGSLWIMHNLNGRLMPPAEMQQHMMQMQR